MKDLVHGGCIGNVNQMGEDRSVEPELGKGRMSLPTSVIMYVSILQAAVVAAALLYTIVETFDEDFVGGRNYEREDAYAVKILFIFLEASLGAS